MITGLNLVKIFTGSELTVNLLREELENNGITSIVKDEFSSGLAAGFAGGVPSAIDLYIQESDVAEAEPIIHDLVRQAK
ncbi:putative signal transducing protein [Gaoshiqia sediminis]|uniref:DUF2007 domain-containing protein n=1 Tax=Gaoshiqia sediminis TaxID=2986998 RepID=A0AA41Y5G1_9BACT|nr:DUF2007 domain-containing protein [Gaoshiqia sediminis]MCW0483764.1 DUF2007 domain-containing protein [Gaoshiqia sediminis]